MGERDVPITDDLRARTATWIHRTRTLRAIGFFVPLIVTGVPAWVLGARGWSVGVGGPARAQLMDLTVSWTTGPLLLPLLGYAGGALLAEWRRPTDLDARSDRRADVRPRRLPMYAEPLARWGPRVLGAAAAVVGTATALVGGAVRIWPTSISLASLGIVVVLASASSRRWVVERPQHAADEASISFDDAARTTTIHAPNGS